ncbi:Condensin-2 complex subunit G2 [Toxocara canis]|uniref:Condensin-2 complex subunit G2 n=1 Tax=Toxocara canis TaxID=6265 RepID=A0A0B2UMY4_TOXCA|nr:Condensin-2 complex subunit G2 [Toxocara canis]
MSGSEVDGEVEGPGNIAESPPSDCHQMLNQALVSVKGQKKLIKKLYSNSDQLIKECSRKELLKAIREPAFLASPEGRKLAAAFLLNIGLEGVWGAICSAGSKQNVKRVLCERYGEVLLLAWKRTEEKERGEVVEVLSRVAHFSLCMEPDVAKNFLAMLQPIRKARCKQVDAMLFTIFLPNLWRSLTARNAKVRFNAIKLLAAFYPIITDDDFVNADFEGRQREALLTLLLDDSYGIRIEACKGALSILSSFWITFDGAYIKQLLGKVVDKLSMDSVVAVRVAVYESMHLLLSCPQAVNALQLALKHLIPFGINDKAERVRVAAFELLCSLKGHRFIQFWDVVEMDVILKCFQVEPAESVRKQIFKITKLLLRSFKPTEADADECIRRILYLGEKTPFGALSFHHLMVTTKLVTVEQALEHVQMLAITVYKMLRHFDKMDAPSMNIAKGSRAPVRETSEVAIAIDHDEKVEIEGTKQWDSCKLLLDCLLAMWVPLRRELLNVDCPVERTRTVNILSKLFKLLFNCFKVEIEGTKQWDSCKLLLDCLLAMWVPLRRELLNVDCPVERTRTVNILSKLFKLLFNCFKDSSLVDSIMVLGSTLSEQRELSAAIMCDLFSASLEDERRVSYYLEVAASWDFPKLLDFMHTGLQQIGSACVRMKERRSRRNDSMCSVTRALLYLKLILSSPAIKQNLFINYDGYLQMFHTDLMPINGVIEAMLDSSSMIPFENRCQLVSLKDVKEAYEFQHVLSIIILNCTKSEETRLQMERIVEQDATWFIETVMPKLATVTDDTEADFLVGFTQVAVLAFSYHLQSYSHSALYKRALADCITMLTTKNTPSAFVIPVLKTLKDLCGSLYERGDEELLDETLVPLTRLCLEWMSERVEDDDFNIKGCAQSFLLLLSALRARNRLTQSVLSEYAKIIIATTMSELIQMNKRELDVVDPRAYSFDAPPVVNLLLRGITLKSRPIHAATSSVMLSMINSKALTARCELDDILYIYGAMAQFVLLSAKNPKQPADSVTACLNAICEQMQQLEEQVKRNDIYGRVIELCRS